VTTVSPVHPVPGSLVVGKPPRPNPLAMDRVGNALLQILRALVIVESSLGGEL